MAGRYAANTEVAADRSRAELEHTLARYGADRFGYAWDEHGRVMISFRIRGRHVRFLMPMPRRDDPEFTEYMQGGKPYSRTDSAAERLWEQATRQRWRALNLVIKANLEAVEVGILALEDAFLAHTVIPDGSTVSEWLQPQLAEAYRSGKMLATLPMLPALPSGQERRP
jgi:hypothetical protein